MKTLIYPLVLLCLVVGCNNTKYRKILDQAQGVIDYQADSAYNLLSPLRLDDIRGKENRARYALLYSKALDKQKIRTTSDTLMSVAMDYYQDRGSRYNRASAYFYSARIDYNGNNIPDAVKKLTFAQENAPSDSIYLRALIYSTMGLCYQEQLNYSQALKCYKEEYALFSELDHKSNVANVLSRQAACTASLRKYDDAVVLCRQAREIYRELCDTDNMFKCEIAIVRYNIHTPSNKLSERNRFIKLRQQQYSSIPKTQSEYDLLGDLFWADMPDSSAVYQTRALIFCDTLTLKDRSEFYTRYSNIAATKGEYKVAYWRLRKAETYLGRFYKNNLINNVEELNVRYKSKLYMARAQRMRANRDLIITISIVVLILLLFLIYIIIRNYQNKLRKADEDLGLAQDLAQAVTNTQTMLLQSSSDIEGVEGVEGGKSVKSDKSGKSGKSDKSGKSGKRSEDAEDAEYAEDFEDLEDLEDLENAQRYDNINYMMSKFNTLIEKMPNYEKQPRKFIDEFVVVMRKQNSQGITRTLFYEIIDRDYPGVLDKISVAYRLNNVEVEVLCMLALGVSNNAIRIIMDYTNNRTIYNCRSAIKAKLNIGLDSKAIFEWLGSEREG